VHLRRTGDGAPQNAKRLRLSFQVALALALVWSAVVATPAAATLRYRQLQLSGSFDSQTLVRHHSPTELGLVQNRNTALLRFEWTWLEKGTWLERLSLPFLKRSELYLLYRGVYDGFYDIAPGGNQRGAHRFDEIVGGPVAGNRIGAVKTDAAGTPILENGQPVLLDGPYSRFTEGARERLKLENDLREAYLDLKLRDLPLSFRLGRQQVIWGESDQFRLMDIWNPLDVTWHLGIEDWDKLRIPVWTIKGIWDIGRLGPLSNSFVEAAWNPGDFHAGIKVEFLPSPWSAPIPNPLRSGQVTQPSPTNPIFFSPFFDLQGTSYRRGDFSRNPEEASDIGLRFHGVTPQGVAFTTNYLYIRGRGIGAQTGTPFGLDIEEIEVPALSDTRNAIAADPGDPFNPNGPRAAFAGTHAVFPAHVKAKFIHPYVHIFGLTGNYFEQRYTGGVIRFETAYALDEPFQTRDGRIRVTEVRPDGTHCDPETESCIQLTAPLAFTKRDVWAGMIGFDRPTFIRWLNAKTTWFLTGQIFWSYVNGKVAGLRGGAISAGSDPYFTPSDCRSCAPVLRRNGIGQWTSGPFAGQKERVQNASFEADIADDVRRWELLLTLATTNFYRGGTVVPFLALVHDPVNTTFTSLFKLSFFLTNDLVVELQQKFFTQFGREQSLDPWALGLSHRRDETGLKLTLQF
jgi:hypothetical protein